MTVSVNVETGRRDRTLAIPNDALGKVQGDQATVLLVRDSKIQRQKVQLGLRGLAMSEVISGLKAGDQVLSDATSTLKDGTRVRFKPEEINYADQNNDASNKNELPVKFE